MACSLVQARAVAMALFSSSFQALATSAASGSSGLGAPRSAWIDSRIVRIWSAGDQLSVRGATCCQYYVEFISPLLFFGLALRDISLLFSTSKQIRPRRSTFGW